MIGTSLLMTAGALVLAKAVRAREGDRQSSFGTGISLAGIPLTRVVYPAGASETERFAASELARYLQKASGFRFSVSEGAPAQGALFVSALIPAGIRTGFRKDGYDRAFVTAKNGCIYLIGENKRSALYAVYDFLQQFVKIEFFGPGESHECIPPVAHITLPALLNAKYGSDMELRDYFTSVPESIDFMAKSRINTITVGLDIGAGLPDPPSPANEIRKRGLLVRGPVHDWHFFMLDPKLIDAHPEYFPMVDGKRTVNNRTACFSNPKAVQIFMDNWREYVRVNRGAWDIITYFPEDVPDEHYCGCPECIKEPNANWYAMLVCKAGKIVDEEAPGTRMEFCAYHSLRTPPTRKFEYPSSGRNLVVNLSLGYDRNLYEPLDSDDKFNKLVNAMLDKQLAYLASCGYKGTVLMQDYYNLCEMPGMGPRTHSFLWPVDVIKKDLQYYKKRGVTAVADWVLYNKMCFPTPYMMWAWLRIWSDNKVDLTKLENRFYPTYFGAAGSKVRDYIHRLTPLMHELISVDNDRNVAKLEKLVKTLDGINTASLPEIIRHRVDVVKIHGLYCILLKKAYHAITTGDQVKSAAYRKEFAAFFTETHGDVLKDEIDPNMFGTDYWWFCVGAYQGFDRAMATDPRLH